ncbi:GT-D fold domain-containing glycosyltransferase [Sabulilitoribacter arenilitoris]|uniref:GT-D fold domain-containing glycosyltransferase n=1 Tax=Wocania arenilitoris TaxID=2044858 RepID=A0AAE3ENY5_9FLAO|nr:GT-D fold domain-containing glycosyltransferase [Wocania arenilitoris]MCF7568951.1 GT-D fold domain-containing glycosyltransferase [Wocania arenilitoris]
MAIIEKAIENNEFGAYLRFGDGDVMLLNNLNDSFQTPSKKLANEMEEAFRINESGVIKSLAIHSNFFGFEQGMTNDSHKIEDYYAMQMLLKTHKFFKGQKVYSSVALHFLSITDPLRVNSFLRLLKSKVRLFVGNEDVTFNTLNKLFGSPSIVLIPKKNAYNEIDSIHEKCLEYIDSFENYGVVVVAMGCSGRTLIKRLLKSKKRQIYYFDFGSLLDGLDDHLTRKWLKVNKLDKTILLKDL